jgi:predicted Zn-dependent protease
MSTKKPRQVAPELLKTQPESVLALTVEMLTKVQSGKIIEARQMAKKIQALTKGEETVSYKAAAQVLAIEPNQP